jgi:hypothetical protein
MHQSATATEQLEEDIVLTSAQRETIRKNGVITTPHRRITIDNELITSEVLSDNSLPVIIFDCRVIEEVLRLHLRAYMLVLDPSGSPALPANSRRWIAEWNRKHALNAVAVVNNSNQGANAVLTLLIRGINMFRRKPMHFALYKREPEARAWLESLRRDPGKSAD